MAGSRRSMSSAAAWVSSISICLLVGLMLYWVLRSLYGIDETDSPYKKPIEENYEVSHIFMEETISEDTEAGLPSAPKWSYSGSSGPQNWGDLAEAYSVCRTGKQQSPIDIVRPQLSSKLLPLRFHYRDAQVAVKNTGFGLEVNYESGSFVEIEGVRYDLMKIEFHSPSEHQIDGIPYEMEVHLIHRNSQAQLAYIAILVEADQVHKALGPLWSHLPERRGDVGETKTFHAMSLMPTVKSYYSYTGSMTTPPCREGVQWFVMTRPISFSDEQIDRYLKIVRYNARPVQRLHGRKVLRSRR